MSPKRPRILFLDGPGNLIAAFHHWRAGKPDPTQTDTTYSGQFFDVASEMGASVHAIAWPGDRNRIEDGPFVVEHWPPPPPARGIRHHLRQSGWAAELSALALRMRANVLVAAAGPEFFFFGPLRAAGVRLVPVLHNTFWPAGHPPSCRAARMILAAHGFFFRRLADATLAVSPECEKQVRMLAPRPRGPILQFRPSYKGPLAEPPSGAPHRPFRVVFAGRMEREKGVLEVVEVAHRLEKMRPGAFRWTLCGDGSAYGEVEKQVRELGLGSSVALRGRIPSAELLREYANSDAVFVPTTAGFSEGLNRTALEAALCGRPVVTSAVTPAAEILGPAAQALPASDIEGYVRAFLRLVEDSEFYRASCAAAVEASRPLLDPGLSFKAVLGQVLREWFAKQ